MADEGFGIAGHKNTYSSKVLAGNWVEDQRGADLLGMRAGMPKEAMMSETMAAHVHPKAMPVRQPNVPEPSGMSAKEGRPRHLLFGHGNVHRDEKEQAAERFFTVYDASFNGKGMKVQDGIEASKQKAVNVTAQFPKKNTKTVSKMKEVAREEHASPFVSQVAQFQGRSTLLQAGKDAVGVPKHARDASFTKGFNSGIRGLRR